MQFNLRNALPKYVSLLLTRPLHVAYWLYVTSISYDGQFWASHGYVHYYWVFCAVAACTRANSTPFKQHFCILFPEGPWQTV